MSMDREMPAAHDAERAVLGSLLMGGTAYERVLPIIGDAGCFRSDAHRIIFNAVVAMNGVGADILTVREALATDGTLDRAGGSAYVAGLLDGIPDIANAERYARIVRDAAIRRRTIVDCQRLQAAAYAGDPLSDIAAEGALLFSDIAA